MAAILKAGWCRPIAQLKMYEWNEKPKQNEKHERNEKPQKIYIFY